MAQLDVVKLIDEATAYDKKLELEARKPRNWCKCISARTSLPASSSMASMLSASSPSESQDSLMFGGIFLLATSMLI